MFAVVKMCGLEYHLEELNLCGVDRLCPQFTGVLHNCHL